MFKKIVSQLSFSPALVGQLSFYAKRLRKEEATRRLGLVFVVLALIVQSLVVFQPPESANAANPSDMIIGGLGIGSARSFNKFLGPYDRNERHLKDIYNYFGITREEITATKYSTFIVGHKLSWGYANKTGAQTFHITNGSGRVVQDLYVRDLSIVNGTKTKIYAYVGYSQKAGWFAIMQACGNLVTDTYPTPPPPPPAPANIVASKTAVNVTQGNIDATKTTARINDKVTFSLNLKNSGGTAKAVDLSDDLTDVLKFSKLTDAGGGTFAAATNTLSWPSVTLGAGASVTKTFSVQMNPSLETTKTSCVFTNVFSGKSVTVPVGCTLPPPNVVLSKTATNTSQGNIDATSVTAHESDHITFTLTAENKGGSPKEVTFADDIGDTLEYSELIDNGGGTYDKTTRMLSWPAVNLAAGAKEIRTFSVKVLSTIPATPVGQSDGTSYNCLIENVFGTDVTIPVTCAPTKIIEHVSELPKTGPTENIIFAGIVLAVVTFFYFRSRQLGTEVRLIRRDINGGTI